LLSEHGLHLVNAFLISPAHIKAHLLDEPEDRIISGQDLCGEAQQPLLLVRKVR
jgi:hypothetical protein